MGARTKLTVVQARTPREQLAQDIESFFGRCRARGLAADTIRFYRIRLDAFTAHLDKHGFQGGAAGVEAATVRDFIAAQRERLSPAAAHHARSTLSAFFRFLAREEVIEANPMDKVEKVRVPRKVIQTLSHAQLEQMLSTCSARSFNGLRLRAIILMLVDCGLRVSELCGLTREDVSWDEGTLRVMGKGSKERVVPFGQATRQALLAYVARRGELPGQSALFVTCYGDPLNRHEAHRLVSECGKRAGVLGVRCSPHTFRHTFAVMYLRNGGDAFTLQKLLGHSDLTMTRRYCELSQVDALEKHRQCSPGDKFLSAVKPTRGRRRLR